MSIAVAPHPPACVCVRCCDRDAVRHNPIHRADREEHRSALAGMSEMERVASCGHSGIGRRVCPDCGLDGSEL